MFSRFNSMLRHAVEALAPNVSVQQEFVAHWKAVTAYFMEKKDHKVAVEQTAIPTHLNQMLRILVEEEEIAESGSTGPSMEYLLQHKILETLYTLARTDCPPGMKQLVLQFFTKLLSRIKQPLLPHVHVHRPVQRMVRLCGEVKAAPSEVEEIQFLCTVCAKLKTDAYLVNFFIEVPKPSKNGNSQSGKQSDNHPDRPVSPNDNSPNQPSQSPSYTIVDSLLNLVQSADARVAVKACEGLLLCATLSEDAGAQGLIDYTNFCQQFTTTLCSLYNKLPKAMDPADIESVEAKWGLDVMSDMEDRTHFKGKRQLISFLSWLDYCDQLIQVAHPMVAEALAHSIRQRFLEAQLEPAILQTSEAGATTATAHLHRCVRLIWSPALLQEFVSFILGDDTQAETPGDHGTHKLRHRLIDRCDHLSEELSITTLKLFETLLQKPNEHIIHNLVLRNLLGRCYALPEVISAESRDERVNEENTDSADSAIANGELEDSGSDGPPSPEKTGLKRTESPEDEDSVSSVTSSPERNPNMDPSIHKVVNCFLCLVPEEAKSSHQVVDSGYDTYLRDAHRQFSDICTQCLSFQWSCRPVCSPDYQEAPHFYEGHFLRVLLDRVSHMLDQGYDLNLQLTSLMAKLAMLPHPNLHEFLLNPFLPVKEDSRTLVTVIKKVVHDVQSRMRSTPNFNQNLVSVRKQLIGFSSHFRSVDDSNLLAGVIVLEEFCKELAAIVFVKYHESSMQL